MNEQLQQLSTEYWDTLMQAFPSSATMLGDHRFNDQIEDFSEDNLQDLADRLASIKTGVESVDASDLNTTDKVTRSMMLWGCRSFQEQFELGTIELQSDQMNGPHASYLTLLPNLNLPQPEYADAILARFEKFDVPLETAADRFRDGLAKGRTPARINIERSLHQIDSYLAKSVDEDPFVNIQGPPEWDEEDEWRDRLRDLTANKIRPAFATYRQVLADELLPAGRSNEQAGLHFIKDGEELYAVLARYYTTSELTPSELHRIGRDAIENQLPDEYAAIGQQALGISDLSELLEKLRGDKSLRFSQGDEMLDVATKSLERATAAMDSWFGRLPQAECQIQVVPDHVAADVPRAYYFPPADDGSRPGTHFVNLHAPEDCNRYDAEAVAFHESIPGHHLQIAIGSELENVPVFQRHALAGAFVEGWGLYSERLSDEMGLYSSDLDRIGMLSGDSWRCGRLVVDTGIHAMGWSRQQAIDYLTANSAVSESDIEVEVDRYIGIPGQALSYKTGEREIWRLRREAQSRLGDRFDIQAFHDVVLGHGSVTLDLLGDLVEEWIAGQ